jgi:hypothetical protein
MTRASIWKRVRAGLDPLSASVLGVGGATWFLSGSWWLPPMTLVAAATVSWAQRTGSPGLFLRSLTDERARACLHLIRQIREHVEGGSPALREALGEVVAPLAPLRHRIGRLCARQAQLEAWLAARPQASVVEQLARLQRELGLARAEVLRQKLSSALEGKQRELVSLESLRAVAQGLSAELVQIRSSLESCCCSLLAFEQSREEGLPHDQIARRINEIVLTLESLEEAFAAVPRAVI